MIGSKEPKVKAFRGISGIFVSYRRDDSMAHAGRLCDRLVKRFGKRRVFMDIDAIRPGQDFVEVLEKTVGTCDVLIALIGSDWLASANEAGRRRRRACRSRGRITVGPVTTTIAPKITATAQDRPAT